MPKGIRNNGTKLGFQKGQKFSEEHKRKLSNSKKDFKNPLWKGDDVGYSGLHGWIKNRKPKTELCERCKLIPSYDLANVSELYKRDINDFEWLCRKCHMIKDGRLNKLKIVKVGTKMSEEQRLNMIKAITGLKRSENTKELMRRISSDRIRANPYMGFQKGNTIKKDYLLKCKEKI